ncbi:hypothetical protein YB2330_000221 [Saitoella coloradoensis]
MGWSSFLRSEMFPANKFAAVSRAANSTLNLNGKNAVVIGGTQGIGAAIALRFAASGANVHIVGRSTDAAQNIISQAKEHGAKGNLTHEHADISSMVSIRKLADSMKGKYKDTGIDYLVQTAGGPPTGKIIEGPEGMEKAFALQCMGRFYTAFSLIPVMNTRSGPARIVWVAAPGQGYMSLDFDDIEQRKSSLIPRTLRQGLRDSAFLDSMAIELTNRNKDKVIVHHVFPGLVNTNAMVNQGFPNWMVKSANLGKSFVTRPPEDMGEVGVYVCTAHDFGKTGEPLRLDSWGGRLKETGWVSDPRNREKLWDWALKKAESAGREKA